MKQLIKSATIFNAELPSAAALREHFAADVFVECLSMQAVSIGFVPREDFGDLVEVFPDGLAFTIRIDQKILPGSVVKSEVNKVAKQREAATGRKPGKKERAEIKEEVTFKFLEHALVRTTLVTCYHHTPLNYLIVPMTNKVLAGKIISLLVNSVGSVKTTTINVADVKGGLTTRLTEWLDGDIDSFAGLEPLNEVMLEETERKVTVRMEHLMSARAALEEALGSGFTVKSIGLQFDNGLALKLTDSFQLRGIEATGLVEANSEDDGDLFVSQAALEVEELAKAITFLCEMFGYAEEAK
jgi:recombination associated protein RdgC